MMKVYDYNIDATKVKDFPINFFHSNAILDEEKIEKVALFNHTEKKRVAEDVRNNFNKYFLWLWIVFDMDSENLNSDESYQETKKMRNLLREMKIPFSLNFSWSKWFHIRIDAERINSVAPEVLEFLKQNPANVKYFYQKLVKFAEDNSILIDRKAFDWEQRSIIRVQWSIHQATWSVVKPLTDEEFDKLDWKKLWEIQEMFRADNLLKWNKELWVEKLNFQKTDFVLKKEINWEWLDWKEIYDKYWKEKSKEVRDESLNATLKELRVLAKENPKRLWEILKEWMINWLQVSSWRWINLLDWYNYDYDRKGDDEALRGFIMEIIKK